jgi:hypothetical protein
MSDRRVPIEKPKLDVSERTVGKPIIRPEENRFMSSFRCDVEVELMCVNRIAVCVDAHFLMGVLVVFGIDAA